MRFKHISAAFAVAILLNAHPHHGFGQSRAELRTFVDDSGSVPPVLQWFNCIKELEAKPYDKPRAQECLDSILSLSEIEKGATAFDERQNLLTFSVESPTLIVKDLDLDISAGDLAKFQPLLSEDALRGGAPYTRHGESRVWFGLDLLFRSEGRRTGVSRTLHLDYARKTAGVSYKIWEGPPVEPEVLPAPYSRPCPVTNLNFNYIDVDDFTPVDLVRRRMRIKPMGCFSETDLREDRSALNSMVFLKESNIKVSGDAGSRSFVFHLCSNPIRIDNVTVHGYGLLSALSEHDIPALTVHAGDVYMRSRAREQDLSLKKFFTKDGWQVKSFTDVQVDSKGKATLDFSILAYPDDVVYVNGKLYDVTFKGKQ